MNPFATPVVVAGVGARTAVGMTAPATAAAVRAGVAGFEKHPFVVDTAGHAMIVARRPVPRPGLGRLGPARGTGRAGGGRGGLRVRCRPEWQAADPGVHWAAAGPPGPRRRMS